MEVVAQPVAADTPELRLLPVWDTRRGGVGLLRAGGLSLFFHVILIMGAGFLPASRMTLRQAPQVVAGLQRATPLVAPPSTLTQQDPNLGSIGEEFDLESLLPRPQLQAPPSRPSTMQPAAQTPSAIEAAAPAVPAPPKIETQTGEVAQLPSPQLGRLPPVEVPAPRIEPEERPKLAFESPGTPAGASAGRAAALRGELAIPSASITEAGRQLARGQGQGGLVVGDLGTGIGGMGDGLNLPPSPGSTGSSLELLSDPMGTDFRPYLIQILSTVRRNWFAVIPSSAKLGRRGRVAIQFAVSRDGGVPKLVIASSSGAEALDRAAVAGISASNPFSPLPTEFRGKEIRLQLTFLYNIQPN